MSRRQGDIERFGHELAEFQSATPPGPGALGGVREHHVVVARELRETVEGRIVVLDDESDTRMLVHTGQETGEEHLACGGEGRHRHFTARGALVLGPERLRPLHGDGDVGGCPSERSSSVRELDAAAGAFGERDTALALEHLELL